MKFKKILLNNKEANTTNIFKKKKQEISKNEGEHHQLSPIILGQIQ